MSSGKIKVTLVRSTSGRPTKHRRTVEALGLRNCNTSKIHQDNDAIRGMIAQVSHLVRVEEA